MFVPRARVQIGKSGTRRGWFSSNSAGKGQGTARYKLKWYECVRMPCLLPTLVSIAVGSLVILSGALMSFVGYNPEIFSGSREVNADIIRVNRNISSNGTLQSATPPDSNWSGLKALTYIGPVFMGIGFFIMMVAAVLYCEIKDKYVNRVLPRKDVKRMKKEALYDMIIEEFRKNYFRGIEVPLRKASSKKRKKSVENVEKELPTLLKALSISQPALLITPDVQRKWQDSRKNTRTPSFSRRKRRFYNINEPWMKTSSLPNIRSKPTAHVPPRLERFYKQKQSRLQTRSCDYTEHSIDSDQVAAEGENKSTGFDNPAFRTSPTEKTPRIQISPPTSPESSLLAPRTTEVIVHISDEDKDGMTTLSVSDSEADSRGYTQKRDVRIDTSVSCDEDSVINERQNSVTSIDDIILQQTTDNEEQLEEQQKPEKLLPNCKSDIHLNHNQRGPYRTLIGIFRSESCLDRIRKLAKTKSENDTDSLDSLTLSDDLMRNFEMTVFSSNAPR